MLIHRWVTRRIKFAGTHLYTWVERGTVRVKCLAHKHNATSPARARTRTARSGVERTNHEATAPPTKTRQGGLKMKRRDFQPKMFATGGPRCPIQFFKTYLAHRPEMQNSVPFYRSIIENPKCGTRNRGWVSIRSAWMRNWM